MRALHVLTGLVILLHMAGLGQAALIQNALDDFTLYAGNKLVTGKNITINGQSGSASDMRLGRSGQINGDLFTHGNLKIGNDTSVAGNVISGNNLTIGTRSTTLSASGGQDVKVNKHAIVDGSLAYGDDVRIHPQAHIRYNLTNCSLSRISRVHGSRWCRRRTTDLDTWHLAPTLSQLPNFPANVAQDGFVLRRDNELTLSPGNYGNVWVAANGTLFLAPGEYDFKNIRLGANAQIVTDSADDSITVNISGNLRSSRGASLFSADETLLTFNVGRNVSVGNGNKVFAMLNSANNMKIGNGSIITGSFVAGNNLQLGKDLEVNSVKTNTIPEPTTLALLSGGLLSILTRRRNLSRGRVRS